MTASTRETRMRRGSGQSETHLFSVGQMVRLRGQVGLPPNAAEFYRVTATMPARDNSLQYRIRSEEERHERVAAESNLELVSAPVDMGHIRPDERNNDNGKGTEAQQPGTAEAETGEGPAEG
ncbi:hypothetical protein [Chelativorans sp.]|uniref:hypothetical protein n=1 Tax=Chelativorans sp. TaxID=2203393 RepID=UPI0028126CEA|nr:hypothetical protein [Chelativorans sp.]